MSLTFPTRPAGRGPSIPGTPTRARHCRCGRGQLLDLNTGRCCRCGNLPMAEIDRTFADRARQIAASRKPKRKAAA